MSELNENNIYFFPVLPHLSAPEYENIFLSGKKKKQNYFSQVRTLSNSQANHVSSNNQPPLHSALSRTPLVVVDDPTTTTSPLAHFFIVVYPLNSTSLTSTGTKSLIIR